MRQETEQISGKKLEASTCGQHTSLVGWSGKAFVPPLGVGKGGDARVFSSKLASKEEAMTQLTKPPIYWVDGG